MKKFEDFATVEEWLDYSRKMDVLRETTTSLSGDQSAILQDAGYSKEKAGSNFEAIVNAYEHIKAIPRKGMIFCGAVGTGKTLAMRSLFPFANSYNLLDVCELQGLKPEKNEENDHLFWNIKKGHVVLDDLGNEPVKKEWGNPSDIVVDFILQWHTARFENPKTENRLFATTNLDLKQLQDRYGIRLLDRLLEMCVVVNFKGCSKRIEPVVFG